MGLSNFIYSAKKNTPQQAKFDPNKKIANFIDATGGTIVRTGENGELVEEPLKHVESVKFNWQECADLKKAGENCLCKKFFSNCAKEKCKGRFPVLK
jgi:hypothetical protein